ncbi:MAG TPA: tetratricopeptide repeat protein, partial [Prolixibacteraceae bacterium]|nr:tetratricopeptide repeat protein [Prolixibacteraceae bacterium]
MIGIEKFACLAIFMVLNYNLFAQTDSLTKIYQTQNGDEKIATGLLICEDLIDNTEAYLSFSLKLSQYTVNDGKTNMFDVLAMRHVVDAYYYADSMEQSAIRLEKAISIAENVVNPDSFIIAQLYNDLSVFFLEDGRLAESKQLLQKAIAYLENSDSLDVVADTKTNLAILYHSEGNYEDAITCFNEVYQIDLRTGNKKNQSSSLN